MELRNVALRRSLSNLIWCIGVVVVSLASYCHSASPPNIVLIVTDQQHAQMMSCAGNQYLDTPALDRLASTGMRFERAYSPNPVCIPSRTAMMTGRYPSTLGFEHNGDAPRADIPDAILQQTMGTLLRRAGYETVFGGKTHWAKGLNYRTCGFVNLTRDSRDELGEKCAAFLHRDHSKPFLLVASFINPHDICYVEIDATVKRFGLPPFSPSAVAARERIEHAIQMAKRAKQNGTFDELCPPLAANHAETKNLPPAASVKPVVFPEPGEKPSRNVYYFMNDFVRREWTEDDWRMHHWIYHRLTEDVDRQIGKVLGAIEESGLGQSTIVIFTSDHGDMDGAHQRVHKSHFYDESARVPFIIAAPGIRSGVDKEHLVSSSLDLIPTVCDFAGVSIPDGMAGRSLRQLVTGNGDSDWRTAIFSENARGRMVRTTRYKYCWYKGSPPCDMLIDMEKDPGEMTNVAIDPAYASVVAKHRDLIRGHVRLCKDKRFIPK